MKRLTIVRHAKSSWEEPGLADFDRPLNRRGERDAPLMARRIAERQPAPDRIVTSPAVRALLTARIMAEAFDYRPDAIDPLESLYLAEVETLMNQVHRFDEAWERVFLFGHEPGVSELVSLLTGSALDHLPTCGVAELELAVSSWREVGPGTARLVELDYPKKDRA